MGYTQDWIVRLRFYGVTGCCQFRGAFATTAVVKDNTIGPEEGDVYSRVMSILKSDVYTLS